MEGKRKYLYHDCFNPGNGIVVTSMVQLSGLCDIPAREISKLIKGSGIYHDPGGRFFIEKVVVIKDDSKVREGNLKVSLKEQV